MFSEIVDLNLIIIILKCMKCHMNAKIITYNVIAHQEELLSKRFVASYKMYTMAFEAAVLLTKYVNSKVDEESRKSKLYIILVLQHMLGRIC